MSTSAMDRGLKKHKIKRKKTFYDPKKHTDRVKQRILDYLIEVNQFQPRTLFSWMKPGRC
jgi:hypothetical protein